MTLPRPRAASASRRVDGGALEASVGGEAHAVAALAVVVGERGDDADGARGAVVGEGARWAVAVGVGDRAERAERVHARQHFGDRRALRHNDRWPNESAQVDLGERGPVWWDDGEPDFAVWYAVLKAYA